jgi:integrase
MGDIWVAIWVPPAGPITGHAFASMFYPWNRIRRRAGLVDLRLHDLRHSFASFLVNQAVSLYCSLEPTRLAVQRARFGKAAFNAAPQW